ncbi:type II toxin-antitoxin system VapC family toxin [uncultured Aureimonas sp.]|uniref:type II toxin-antitoxin system VapC family toxin n=1 Tax=uncultured Aureimonas sp. TaxID=1604662 RepID=UPI0025F323EE|nr:type II toxin-antitoxin system VapC family toxin [uncultured Aureimonas sp.]
MTTSTLVDSNVFIDVLGTGPLHESALDALTGAADQGVIVLSPVVWAELAFSPMTEPLLYRSISWLSPKREPFPFEAAYPAGQAHRLYRMRGGRRDRTLPDFLIGAHAMVAGHRLLTRDASRYREYFPDLDILCPETHP